MKKSFLFILAAVVAVLCGCETRTVKRSTEIEYRFDGIDQVIFINGHRYKAQEFKTDWNNAVWKYKDQVDINEQAMLADLQEVVNKHNNYCLYGDVAVKKSTDGVNYSVITNYSLKLGNKVYAYNISNLSGPALSAFSEALDETVYQLDQKEHTDQEIIKEMDNLVVAHESEKLVGQMLLCKITNNTQVDTLKVYTFEAEATYRPKNTASTQSISYVKGHDNVYTEFRSKLRRITTMTEPTDEKVLNLADSVWNAYNHAGIYTKPDSVISILKSADYFKTSITLKTYTYQPADYVIGFDTAHVSGDIFNRMYDKLSATMLGLHHANKLYDAANVNEVKNTLRAAVMEQKKTTTGAQLDVLILSYEDGVYRQLDTIQVR